MRHVFISHIQAIGRGKPSDSFMTNKTTINHTLRDSYIQTALAFEVLSLKTTHKLF